jgi:hypothetical protein
MFTKIIVGTVTVTALLLASCGTDPALAELARDTCAVLEDVDGSRAGPTIIQAISEADSLGFAEMELKDAMRGECPSVTNAIYGFLAKLIVVAPPIELLVTTEPCSGEGARGTVTNSFDHTVSVVLAVYYFDKNGTIVDASSRSLLDIPSGETGSWDDKYYTPLSESDTCEAVVNIYYKP